MEETKKITQFYPIIIAAILKTFGSGLVSLSMATHLIYEKNMNSNIVGIVTGLGLIGFLLFSLLLGHISDKYGPKNIIKVICIISFCCSFIYMIPINNTNSLIVIGIALFIDGGAGGCFWPTIQGYSIIASKFGPVVKNKYLQLYNFSFNFGIICSMGGGFLVVYFTNNNYNNFIFNVVVVSVMLLNAIFLLKQITPPEVEITFNISEKKGELNEGPQQPTTSKPIILPLIIIFSVLLIDSTIQGAIKVYIPYKFKKLNLASSYVFLGGLVIRIFQTIFSSSLAKIPSKFIIRIIYLSSLSMIIVWTSMIFSQNWVIIFILISLSGGLEGSIYACCMKLTSYKAEEKKTSRVYSYYQGIMGGGRAFGTLIVGLLGVMDLNYGIIFLLIYYSIALLNFCFLTQRRKRDNAKSI